MIRQFLGESVLLSISASLISIPLTLVALPFVNTLTQGDISYFSILDWRILALLAALGIFTGLVAGIYPALILSSIKPIKVLKTSVNLNFGNGYFRKVLVVFQFVISISLISGVIIITQQVNYSQKMDMGFDKESLLAVKLGTQDISARFNSINTNFRKVKGVKEVTGTNYYPSEFIFGDMGLILPGASLADRTLVHYNGVSSRYLETVGTKLLAGRTLNDKDENQILVNKATLDAFKIPFDKAIGAILVNNYGGQTQEFEIVGVTENYNFGALKDKIKPLLLYNETEPSYLVVKAETQDYKTLLKNLETSWETINPNAPFVYNFIDKEVEKLYAEEKRLSKISAVFTSLAILISCLGLFGLVSFIAEQKKKEIGIRKVLGASIQNVVRLLTKDFIKLIGVAFLISTPLAYFIMQKWLQDFPYRITIEWWVFAIAGGFALIITIMTVSFQAIKAAIANPVKSLRTE